MGEPNGPVWPPHGAAAMNPLIAPDFTRDDSGVELFDLLRRGQRTVRERQGDGESAIFRVAIRGRALNPEANAMVRLGEILEEVEDFSSLPGLQVDLLPSVREGFLHGP